LRPTSFLKFAKNLFLKFTFLLLGPWSLYHFYNDQIAAILTEE